MVPFNGYHPCDYEFEVCFYTLSVSRQYNDDSNISYVAFEVSKEIQNDEQTYLEKAAKDIKEKFTPQIKGETWFND